ncbi:MAG: hypothetical protein HY268_34265 [Deltaproteobacteria bacterium]|nr:hypothetical protein [Deltaproteobacteria bacterium]
MKCRTVLVFSVALALTFVVGATRASADNLPGTFDLEFDGYCDGMHLETLTTKIQKSATGWLVQGSRTGCASEDIVGVNVTHKNLDVNFAEWGTSYLFIIRVNHTWSIYINTGDGAELLNAGTWSFGSFPLAVLNSRLPKSTEPQ